MNFQPIFWGGLIAGTLDIVAACVSAWLRGGTTPVRVLQFVASGLLGPSSFNGGAKTAIVGLALHFLIATGATTVFYFLSRKWLFLVERPVIAGLLYGVGVYAFMNFVYRFHASRSAPQLFPDASSDCLSSCFVSAYPSH
jgi:hypothetical protein